MHIKNSKQLKQGFYYHNFSMITEQLRPPKNPTCKSDCVPFLQVVLKFKPELRPHVNTYMGSGKKQH